MEKFESIIIGAGPAGLSAALYLARANRKIRVLEKGAPGGKLLTLPEVANYPGMEPVTGMALAYAFVNSAAKAGIGVSYGDVKSVSKTDDGFLVSDDASSYLSDTVIVATGLSFIPTIPGEKEHISKGVSYCATCDGRFFKNKEMALIGNGDRALEEALYLAPLASRLHFFVVGELSGSERYITSLKNRDNVFIHPNSKVTSINGEEKVSGLTYLETGESHTIDVSAVFPLSGAKSAAAFLSPLGLDLEHGFIKVDEKMMVPSIPGLFAIGDIIVKGLRQVVTAASDGAIASQSVINYLSRKK